MCDLLWSDPQDIRGRSASKRGVGCQFGPDITNEFCEKNGIDYVIRFLLILIILFFILFSLLISFFRRWSVYWVCC